MDLQHIPRQKFVAGAGLALAATAVGACTSNGDKPEASSETPTAPSGSATTSGDVIAKTSAVPVGSGVIVGKVVVTQPSAGVFNALSATCTHQGCTVSEVAGGTINCPCHGSKYNLDGSVANGPASIPLSAVSFSVQGDSIVKG